MTRGLAALLALGLATLAAAPAYAQSLQRLTITRLTLRADTAAPKLEVPFHLIVEARVDQRIGELDNVDLPILADLELLGDERRLTSAPGGTTYRETITVVAHHTGDIHIDPVTLAAVDARDGRAKRYFSNDLTVHVGGGSLEPFAGTGAALAAALRLIVRVVIVLIVLALLTLVLAFVLASRRRRAEPVQPVVEPMPLSPLPPLDPRAPVREALALLQGEGTRAAAFRARSLVRRMVGATDGETLADVLHRSFAADPDCAGALRSLERAAFTYDGDLDSAILDAIAALKRVAA